MYDHLQNLIDEVNIFNLIQFLKRKIIEITMNKTKNMNFEK